jgi:outer membrane receptor protein involved in Fe transport
LLVLRNRILATSAFLLAGWAYSPAVFAQEEDLEMELFFTPAETVTSAARHAQPLEHSPSAITVFTQEDIRASGARTLPELLRLVPGMDINMVSPTWYSVGVRGGTLQMGDSILLLVDGRDLTAEFLGAPLWTVLPCSMDDIARIEVIRGPGSSLYGANAYAGVVNVTTIPAGDGQRARASVRGGERGTREVSVRATESFGPLALGLNAGIDHQDLWTGRGVLGRDVLRGRLNGGVGLGEETDLSVEAGAYLANGFFGQQIGETQLQDLTNVYARMRFEHQDLMVQALYDRLDFKADMGFELNYQKMVLAEVPLVEGAANKVELEVQQADTLFFNRITYGTEYIYSGTHSLALADPDHGEHRLSVFAQDEVQLDALLEELSEVKLPPLMVTAGLRFDYYTEADWELSPRAALVFAPTDSHSIRFGYAHAFLKPTFMQTSLYLVVIDVSGMGFEQLDLTSPGLKNQTIDSLELGWSGSFFSGRMIVRLDLAYNWYNNRIWFNLDPGSMRYREIGGILVPDIEDLGIGYENDKSGDRGHNVELQVIIRPTDNSRLFAQAGYRQVFDEKTRLFNTREPVLRAAAGADIKTAGGVSASLRGFFCSSYSKPIGAPGGTLEPAIRVKLPQAFMLNARVAFELLRDPVRVSAGVEIFNLLGTRFREFAGTTLPNRYDFGGERLGRKIVFFLQGAL